MNDEGGRSAAAPQTWHYGLVARWWAEFSEDGPEIAYFQKFVERGQPALDVACGTGRLLVPFLRAGLDVDGCDVSADMIESAAKKRSAKGSPDSSCNRCTSSIRPAGTGRSSSAAAWSRKHARTRRTGAATLPRTPRTGRHARLRRRSAVLERLPVAVLAEAGARRPAESMEAAGETERRRGSTDEYALQSRRRLRSARAAADVRDAC